jgi:hypothetical protein
LSNAGQAINCQRKESSHRRTQDLSGNNLLSINLIGMPRFFVITQRGIIRKLSIPQSLFGHLPAGLSSMFPRASFCRRSCWWIIGQKSNAAVMIF